MTSTTPQDLIIKPRHIEFDLHETLQTNWLDNDLAKTTILNSMSVLFPLGEKFFIDSVRAFQDQVDDPVLMKQVRGFIGQEAIHSREHKKYNDALKSRGYKIDNMEHRLRKSIAFMNKITSEKRRLAVTCGFEHFTAILADLLLRHDDVVFKGADPKMMAVWKWHAVEETEHKAVAFDVYRQIGGGELLRRWIMFEITISFLVDVLINFSSMLKTEGKLFNWSVWKSAAKFLLGKNGALRLVWKDYKDYYRKGFHPWDHKNGNLIDKWTETYDEHYAHLAKS